VKAELDVAKRVGPKVRDEVALIRFHSPCQIHPLVAQQWRGRLKDKIVLAANTGYRPGWVHFAARTGTDRNLIDFLAERRPSAPTRITAAATPGDRRRAPPRRLEPVRARARLSRGAIMTDMPPPVRSGSASPSR
jgi:hypothetical protein